MEEIKLEHEKNEARGRNGWFKPRKALVSTTENQLILAVESRRPAQYYPIHLKVLISEAVAIARAILKASGQKQQIIVVLEDGLVQDVSAEFKTGAVKVEIRNYDVDPDNPTVLEDARGRKYYQTIYYL